MVSTDNRAQGNLDDWEYKLVKIRGYFKEHRIYVRRRKDGKDGYAVFAPFITASENLSPDPTAPVEHPQIAEHGVMVNLGWIPVENKNEVKGTDEPLPLVEWDGENMPHNYVDPHSGFIYKTKYNEETEVKPKYTDLTAIVRRGESWNPLIGNVNFPKDKLFQFVDLDLFSRVFLFNNHDTSRAAYLERIVPSLDESKTYAHPRRNCLPNRSHQGELPV
jgi:surfeit locus 1 family protein